MNLINVIDRRVARFAVALVLVALLALASVAAALANAPDVLPVEPNGGIGGEIVLPVEPDGGIGD